MKRNNAGVTITALVVTLIVLTIMLSVTMNVSTELLSDSKIKSYISEMYTVQARVKSMAESLEFETDNYEITAEPGDITSQKKLMTYYKKIFSTSVSTTLLDRLGYYSTTNNINKIGEKVVGADNLDKIPGVSSHPEYKQDPLADCWFIWNAKVISDNGFDASMLNDSTYYVNYCNYEVILTRGFTTTGNNKQTVYSLSDMLKVR